MSLSRVVRASFFASCTGEFIASCTGEFFPRIVRISNFGKNEEFLPS